MKSSNLSKDIKDNPVLNENHNIYLSNIKNHYILNNILKHVPLKKQKYLFFGLPKKKYSNSEGNKNNNIINDITNDDFGEKSFINKKMK